jgi:hypothetical protein
VINLRPLIETRLKTITDFKEVAGAADLANILQGRMSDPGCYVFEERETAGENSLATAVVQRVMQQFSVIIVVRNVKDSKGADAADTSYSLQASVITALVGWTPSANAEPLEYVSGSLVSFENGFLIYKNTFKTAQYLRALG